MKLMNIKLENFRGFKSAEFDFNGQSTNIYGDNGTGKTTIYDAFTWLLFGKPSQDIPNFEPKPRDNTGKCIHNTESIVEALIETGGKVIELKRVFKEKWTRKRGEASSEFSGNTNEYFINGVPTKESDYYSYIENIAPKDKAMILTKPMYFAGTLPWEKRREILFDIFGGISDQDIIAANSEFAGLSEILGNCSLDDFRKIAKAKCSKVNNELKLLPERIDEAQKAVPDITGLDAETIESQIRQYEVRRSELLTAKASMNNTDALASIRTQIAELEAGLIEKKMDYISKIQDENKNVYDEINKTERAVNALLRDIERKRNEAENIRDQAVKMRLKRQALKKKYEEINAEEWRGDTACPTCERAFEPEKIKQIQDAFIVGKKKRADAVKAEVKEKCSKESEKELTENAGKLLDEADEGEATAAELRVHIKNLKSKLKEDRFEESEFAINTNAQITELRSQTSNDAETEDAAQKQLDIQISDIAAKINALNTEKARFSIKEAQEIRIEQLCAREKELAASYEELQYSLNICEDFMRTKAKMISDNISSKFKNVSFALFKDQINGGLQEICDVMVPSVNGAYVSFAEANSAAKLNAGIEIIDTLANHFGISLPLFVDNRESVTQLTNTGSIQVISLIVSEKDKELRLEINEKNERGNINVA